jgi:hypothetical protein
MPGACERHGDQPGRTPEQTHDDCQGLDEKDGEENVFRDGIGAVRGSVSPRLANGELRRLDGEHGRGTRHRGRNHDDLGRRRRFGRVAALGQRAAVVSLRLGQRSPPVKARRLRRVHRTVGVRAACHARLSGRRPARAEGCVADDECQRQRDYRDATNHTHHAVGCSTALGMSTSSGDLGERLTREKPKVISAARVRTTPSARRGPSAESPRGSGDPRPAPVRRAAATRRNSRCPRPLSRRG